MIRSHRNELDLDSQKRFHRKEPGEELEKEPQRRFLRATEKVPTDGVPEKSSTKRARKELGRKIRKKVPEGNLKRSHRKSSTKGAKKRFQKGFSEKTSESGLETQRIWSQRIWTPS